MLFSRYVFLGLGLLATANLAYAALIPIQGDHFTLTYDDAQVGPYDQGFLSGSQDTVYFLPTQLNAFSGGAPVSTSASLQLTLTIDAGYGFAGLEFAEWGDYFLSGGGSVDAVASLQALSLDTLTSSILDLAPGSPLSQTGTSTHWELGGVLSPLGLGASQTLQLTLNNELTAAPADGVGFIQKTYAGFRVLTEPKGVPEPSSWALLLAGMLAALLVGGRQRAKTWR